MDPHGALQLGCGAVLMEMGTGSPTSSPPGRKAGAGSLREAGHPSAAGAPCPWSSDTAT